jgi:crotonobetainyl-CoA:carnitine CoA-transferase CaiB-like acyl-CoA transferase
MWVQEGRNKRSITIDLHHAEGQALLRRLAGTCDVVVENFRPGVAEGWGVDAATLRAEHPRLIVLRLSGYGQTGPYRAKPAFDRVAQAFAGSTFATGFPDSPPVRDGYALADYMGAYLGAYAIMLALYHRDARGGQGQVIDLALYEPVFRATEGSLNEYGRTGRVRGRNGNRNAGVVPADNFLAADGVWVVIHAGSDRLWPRLARAMERDDLLNDERFRTTPGRIEH